jgi:hypothetical protein
MSHNAFGTGWDVSSSVGQGRVIPGTDAIFGIGKFEQRFVNGVGEIGGPAGGMITAFLQALADDNPNTLLRWQRSLPAAVKNIDKMYGSMNTGEIQDLHGRAVITDPTAMEIAGQGLGFRPSRAATVQERRRLQHDAAEFYAERRTNLMEMYYQAKKSGNGEVLEEVKDSIAKYNSQVPFPQLGVRQEDIARSIMNRSKLEQTLEAGRSPQKRYQLLFALLNETYSE